MDGNWSGPTLTYERRLLSKTCNLAMPDAHSLGFHLWPTSVLTFHHCSTAQSPYTKHLVPFKGLLLTLSGSPIGWMGVLLGDGGGGGG